MIPAKAFHVSEVEKVKTKPPAFMGRRQSQQPVSDLLVIVG